MTTQEQWDRAVTRWQVYCYADSGEVVTYPNPQGGSYFAFDDAADLAMRLEKQTGKRHGIKSVKWEDTAE